MDGPIRLFDGRWFSFEASRFAHSRGCPYINLYGAHCKFKSPSTSPVNHKNHSFHTQGTPVPCGQCVAKNLDYIKAKLAWPWR